MLMRLSYLKNNFKKKEIHYVQDFLVVSAEVLVRCLARVAWSEVADLTTASSRSSPPSDSEPCPLENLGFARLLLPDTSGLPLSASKASTCHLTSFICDF